MADVVQFMGSLWTELDWFIQLGYVVIISTIVSMLLVNLWKVTFLKKRLLTASATDKDKLLGNAGTITSLLVYGVVYISNEMIVQGTFAISIDWNVAWLTISSGAAVVWVAAKGLYTVLHKFSQRIKDGKLTKDEQNATKSELSEVGKAVKAEKSNEPVTLEDSGIGRTL